jgi:hypothetical protein
MTRELDYGPSADTLRRATGVVIPVFIPSSTDPAFARRMVHDTAAGFAALLDTPTRVCLSVDGSPLGLDAARAAARELGVSVLHYEANRGKLFAVRHGMSRLLADTAIDYLAVADQDGDHFANELLNFIRAARHVEHTAALDRVIVLGQRATRHHPMGFLRGELEELADRLLLDALTYHAALSGRPLRMEFASPFGEYPDFHSGFKLFTRRTAEAVFLPEPNPAGLPEDAVSRHAVEAVMTVEAILSGALLAVLRRSTFDEQPVSAFGLFNRRRMTADMILWPCRRLGAPREFVAQWIDNCLPRILLGTLVPQGREELLEVRRLVLETYGAKEVEHHLLRPRFQ